MKKKKLEPYISRTVQMKTKTAREGKATESNNNMKELQTFRNTHLRKGERKLRWIRKVKTRRTCGEVAAADKELAGAKGSQT
jgi:hypothetical protein